MSSHHIVREKQEPALLVLGLENFPDELLGQLLEWSPTVITTPLTAEKLVAYGIKIDWIITNAKEGDLQSNVKLMSCGDDGLADTALEYLADNGFPSVNIITDEFRISDYQHFADRINLVIFNDRRKIYPVVSGFSKWKPAGENLELLDTADNLVVEGLEKIQHHSYKTTGDGFIKLYFNNPFLFIAEDAV